jgi:hypothetical protein
VEKLADCMVHEFSAFMLCVSMISTLRYRLVVSTVLIHGTINRIPYASNVNAQVKAQLLSPATDDHTPPTIYVLYCIFILGQ